MRSAPAFTARGVRCQRLTVSHAFHSPLVEPMLDAFEAQVARTTLPAAALRLISNLTGAVVDAPRSRRSRATGAVTCARRCASPTAWHAGGAAARRLSRDRPAPDPARLRRGQLRRATGVQPALVASLRKGRDDDRTARPRRSARCISPAWRSTGAPCGAPMPQRWSICRPTRSSASRCWFPQRPVDAAAARTAATRCSACACVRRCATSCSSSRCSAPTRCRTSPTIACTGRPFCRPPASSSWRWPPGARSSAAGARLQDVVIVEPLRFARRRDAHRADGRAPRSRPGRRRSRFCRRGERRGRLAPPRRGPAADGRAAPPRPSARRRARALPRRGSTSTRTMQQLAARGLDFGPSLRGLRNLARATARRSARSAARAVGRRARRLPAPSGAARRLPAGDERGARRPARTEPRLSCRSPSTACTSCARRLGAGLEPCPRRRPRGRSDMLRGEVTCLRRARRRGRAATASHCARRAGPRCGRAAVRDRLAGAAGRRAPSWMPDARRARMPRWARASPRWPTRHGLDDYQRAFVGARSAVHRLDRRGARGARLAARGRATRVRATRWPSSSASCRATAACSRAISRSSPRTACCASRRRGWTVVRPLTAAP